MTKKEIIKQELLGVIYVPETYPSYYNNEFKLTGNLNGITVVDLDKLADFLAKYIDIKIDDEKVESQKILSDNTTYNKDPDIKVKINSKP